MPGPSLDEVAGDLIKDDAPEPEGDDMMGGMVAENPDVSSVRSAEERRGAESGPEPQHVTVRRRVPLDQTPPERFTDAEGREWRLTSQSMQLPETQVQGEAPDVQPVTGGMASMASQARTEAEGAPVNPEQGQDPATALMERGSPEGTREVWYEPVPQDMSDQEAIQSAMSSPAAEMSPFNQTVARAVMPDPEERHAMATGVADIGAMGWLDEIAAKLARETGQSEEEARQQAEEFFKGVEQRNPTAHTAGQATGLAGLMAAPTAAGGARGLGALSRAGAAEGAAYGAVSGAGEAPPGQRGVGAALGGGVGLATGAAAPVVMRGAGKVSQPVREYMARKAPELRKRAAETRIASTQPAGGHARRDLHNIEKTFRGAPGGPGGVEGAAQTLDEAGVYGKGLQRAFSTSEDVARRAGEVHERAGREIGEIIDRASAQADEPAEPALQQMLGSMRGQAGEPPGASVLYHGSPRPVGQIERRAMSFTDDPVAAAQYARGGGTVHKVAADTGRVADEADVRRIASDYVDPDTARTSYTWDLVEQYPEVSQRLQSEGYAGYRVSDLAPDNVREHSTVTLFDPTGAKVTGTAPLRVASEDELIAAAQKVDPDVEDVFDAEDLVGSPEMQAELRRMGVAAVDEGRGQTRLLDEPPMEFGQTSASAGPYREPAMDAAPPGTVIGDDLAQQIQARVIDPIEQGAGQYNPAQTRALNEAKEVVNRLRGEGPMDVRELQAIKQSFGESLNWDRYNANQPPLSLERLRGVYSTIRDAQEGAIDEAGRALDDPQLLERLQKAKREFGATDRAASMADDFAFRQAGRREWSPSDYGVSLMAGAGGMMADGGAYSLPAMIAAGLANRAYRAREKPLWATGREATAKVFERAAERQLPAGTRAGRLEGATGTLSESLAPATAEAQAPERQPTSPGRAVIDAIEGNPDALGQYAAPLQQAYQSGGDQAVQARHFILQQRDPEYRRLIRQMQDPDQESDQ